MTSPRRDLVLAGTCTGVPLLLSLWIVNPAPHEWLALLAVPLCEGWSLWLALLSLWGILRAARLLPRTLWALLPLCAGVTSLVWSTAPVRALLAPASREGIALNPLRAMVASLEGDVVVVPRTKEFHRDGDVSLKLDAYIPEGTGPFPAMVIIHGGGWRARDKSDFPEADAWWMQQGWAVFDVQYRLDPAPNWQAAVGDVKCALRYLRAHAEELRIHHDDMTLLGRSAGAQLALLAATTVGHPRLPSSCEGEEPRVRQVVSFYGPTDLALGYANPANPSVYDGPANLRRFLGGTPDDDPMLYALLSPVTHVTGGMPRTLLFHGVPDQYVRHKQLEMLTERLVTARVEHRAVSLPHAQHGFDFVVGGLGWQLATATMQDFLIR